MVLYIFKAPEASNISDENAFKKIPEELAQKSSFYAKIGPLVLFITGTLNVFWLSFLLGAKIAFDQSNLLLSSFFLSIGGWIILFSKIYGKIFNKSPTEIPSKGKQMTILLSLILFIGTICGYCIWLKYFLLTTLLPIDQFIIYEVISVISIGFLLAVVILLPKLRFSVNHSEIIRTEPDLRIWFTWITLVIAIGEMLGIRTLTNANFYRWFIVVGPIGIVCLVGSVGLMVYFLTCRFKKQNFPSQTKVAE
jgi:hypothetical protein